MALADLRERVYNPTEWEDRVEDQSTGEVLVEGTPVNEVNLNNLEAGMLLSHVDIGLALAEALLQVGDVSLELDKYKRQRFIQGEATIINDNPGSYLQDPPVATVALPSYANPLTNAPNYAVQLEIVYASDSGAVGELRAYDKAQNGFKVSYSGSASQVIVIWTILNPEPDIA